MHSGHGGPEARAIPLEVACRLRRGVEMREARARELRTLPKTRIALSGAGCEPADCNAARRSLWAHDNLRGLHACPIEHGARIQSRLRALRDRSVGPRAHRAGDSTIGWAWPRSWRRADRSVPGAVLPKASSPFDQGLASAR